VTIQSVAIARYAAKLANLYPTDPLEALFVDEIIDTVNDLLNSIPNNSDATVLKGLREEWAAGKLNILCTFFANKLKATPGAFFRGDKFCVADLFVYAAVKVLRSGKFDHIPITYDSKWPEIGAFVDALEADAVFAPYKLEV
jgi:prostaglandin-H2 D-isomerase / glutathione transferase